MAWSDLEEVFRIHLVSAVMTELFNTSYVVDHLVPLTHPLVCGFHTHDNLCIITAGENSTKSNQYWPDMWPIEWGTLAFLLENEQYSSN